MGDNLDHGLCEKRREPRHEKYTSQESKTEYLNAGYRLLNKSVSEDCEEYVGTMAPALVGPQEHLLKTVKR
ncbi:hypothetical protein DPMN_108848 [Dreissena polymorpha]|uniref:Uncharacterized protein n=1 Tax=Dreissena polymorpha TaxID=45954 RepID=A0A9D4K9W7_DREPO|nr:hypothetical protein DPMN_108848 [Dreissena polymorpha]